MTLVKTNNSLFPSLWDNFFDHDWFVNENLNSKGHSLPAVNIKEEDDKYLIEFAAPGKKKEDFNINLNHKVLTISSTSKNEISEERYSRREFSYQSFKRSFTLPNSVNEEEIKARYEDGILYVFVPKRSEAIPKPNRRIEID